MPIFCMSFGSCLERVGVTRLRSLAGGWLRKPVQMPSQAGAARQVVAAVDALALELVEAAPEVLRGQEDDRLDARERLPDVELPGGLLQLGLELLGLLIGEVQRVLDRPGLVAVAEQPGRAVVGGRAGVALDLDEKQAAGGRDEQVDLADVAAGRR